MLRFFSCLNNLLAVIVTAGLAYAVSNIVFAAMRALYHAGHFELPDVGTSLVTSRLGCFSLRYSHLLNLPRCDSGVFLHSTVYYTTLIPDFQVVFAKSRISD